ncbi:hypothetical protein GCM10009678_63460 [Actinomadura kijaniata]|uniref:Uncharacterized protein n=1 Tax=Actinomadura namibiensis TaxID=182080 RepID=A0A7W3QQH8_ACTNM|nr:hypothetical protein [Actinomadura namibiensis]MBA8955720.1 hypothetical protein [Actinomadura namibiensis]
MGTAEEIAAAVADHPLVRAVEPIGSRAPDGFRAATELSDWDFAVSVEDFGEVAGDLPRLVAPYDPVAVQWDPLGDHACYLVVLPGPVKVDLVFPEVARRPNPPWRVGPDTLPAIDVHFWCWTLGLVAKRRHGMNDRVRGELLRMSGHLLAPLGVREVPSSLEEAATRYLRARDRLETRYGQPVPRRLEREILPLVGTAHDDRYRPSGLSF